MPGPLSGIRVIELAGIGPCPFAAMLFADLGAEVIRVERSQAVGATTVEAARLDLVLRGRRSIAVDLKHPDGVALLLDLVEQADVLVEGFRPGAMERLGVGPEVCLARNPKLVFGRMTGWGQDGPYAQVPGHDINYIAIAGVLAHLGRSGEVPVAPINLVGDYGGGAMFLAFGVVAALLEAQRTGRGQVVDAAMVDGSALMMILQWSFRHQGLFDTEHHGTNLLDSGAHFYETYRCADGRYISVGAIERHFYRQLVDLMGADDVPELQTQGGRQQWPPNKERFAAIFASKTRSEWCELLEGTDACFTPVLRMDEAAEHPHNVARSTFVEIDGIVQPAPAPRFSRTVPDLPDAADAPGEHTVEVLVDWGIERDRIDLLLSSGAIVAADLTRTS